MAQPLFITHAYANILQIGAETTTISHLDQPDFVLAQLNGMLVQADMIGKLDLWGTPVISDMGTGRGDNTLSCITSALIALR